MTWQLATAKIYNGSTWVNATGGSDIYQATMDGTTSQPTTSTPAVTITAGTPANTKGAWVQLVASTPYDAHRLFLNVGVTFQSTVNTSSLLDVGVGAAGAETAILSNLGCGYSQFGFGWDIPIYIAAGTRISIRWQSAVAGKTVGITYALAKCAATLAVNPSTTATTWGANTANSAGVTAVPAVGSKGAWMQVTADCGTARKWLGLCIQGNQRPDMQANTYLLDIGIGAAGSETVIIKDINISTNNSEWVLLNSLFRQYFVNIPANSRIAIRGQNSNVLDTFRIDVILFGQTEVGSR